MLKKAILAALVLMAMIRQMATSLRSRKLERGGEHQGPNGLQRAARRRLQASHYTFFGVLALISAVGSFVWSWHIYSAATTLLPNVAPMHDLISLYVPADASNAYLSLVGDHDVLSIAPKGQQKPLSIFVRMHAPNKKGCLPFVIYSEGDAQLEGVEADVFGENSRIDETPIESGAAKLIRSKACYDDIRDTFIAEMGVNRLHGNISFTGHSSTIYRLPDLAAQGTKIASKEMLRTPLDSTLFDDMLTGVYSRKIRVGCDVDLGPMAIVERLDVARPELSKSYADPSDPEVPSGDRIYWDKCLMGGKTAVVSDIQMEQDASTKVFVAGALIGVSVSLLSFAIELFFEAFRHRAE